MGFLRKPFSADSLLAAIAACSPGDIH